MKTAASYWHFVPVDACLPKLPLCFLHCQLTGTVQKAISLIFLATTFFSYSAWDWSSFTERRPRGTVLDFRRNGQRWNLRHRSSWWVELLKNIRHAILILGVWEWQFYCRSTESLRPASFVCKSFLASPLVTTVILVTDQVTFPYLPCSWWFSNLAAWFWASRFWWY